VPLPHGSKLRKRGVTLHLLLESDREEIPDVPAIYFVEPSAENIQRVSDGEGFGGRRKGV
jgi:sec1 family domain-containing protein 1